MDATPAAPTAARQRVELKYLPGVDGLRAIAVLAVLLFHELDLAATTSPLRYTSGFSGLFNWWGGFFGVEVFFVISGYLITTLLLTEQRGTGTVNLPQFWLRRARRLLPALFLMLAVVIAYSLLFVDDAVGALKSDTVAALTYTSNWWQIFAHRSYFEVAGRPPMLRHLWSLAIEEQFYLLWPLILGFALPRWGRQRVLYGVIAVTIGSALLSTTLHGLLTGRGEDPSAIYYATPLRLSGILAGVILAFIWAPHRLRGRPGRGARLLIDAVGIAGLLLLFRCFRHYEFQFDRSTFSTGFTLVDIGTVMVLAAVVHPAGDIGRWLGVTPLRWIGQRSYGIYLWHWPIFVITRPEDWRDMPGLLHDLQGWPVFVIRFGLTMGVAALSYRYVEMPIRRGALNAYFRRAREARGPRRQRLVRQYLTIGMAVLLGAGVLTVGLAAANPPAVQEEEDGPGNQPNREAVALAQKHATSSTGAVNSSSTTTKPGTGGTTPKTTAPKLLPAVFGLGDSVMLGARESLEREMPGIIVDAKVSRQFYEGTDVVRYYRDNNILANTVIIHLGTNGPLSEGTLADLMHEIGPNRKVILVTSRVPRSWQGPNNDLLRHQVKRYPNAVLANWFKYGGPHDDWFVKKDGFHLTGEGARKYAKFLKSFVTGKRKSGET